jgi:hypothetical protein
VAYSAELWTLANKTNSFNEAGKENTGKKLWTSILT